MSWRENGLTFSMKFLISVPCIGLNFVANNTFCSSCGMLSHSMTTVETGCERAK
jgi:hypothetical protein